MAVQRPDETKCESVYRYFVHGCIEVHARLPPPTPPNAGQLAVGKAMERSRNQANAGRRRRQPVGRQDGTMVDAEAMRHTTAHCHQVRNGHAAVVYIVRLPSHSAHGQILSLGPSSPRELDPGPACLARSRLPPAVHVLRRLRAPLPLACSRHTHVLEARRHVCRRLRQS